MDERLKLAFATALRAQHDGGRVEIHLGSDVVTHLKALAFPGHPPVPGRAETIWGFPVIDTTASPSHISVHVVTTIP